jgi:hypothetical protein
MQILRISGLSNQILSNKILAFATLLLLLLSAPFLSGQAAGNASLQGTILDPTGAVIPEATVTLTNSATQVKRVVVSDTGGLYSFPNTAVGTYSLTVTKTGFQTYVQTGIVLEVGSAISINVPMTVGSQTERVEVRAEGLALQTEDVSFKQTIDQQTITEMPLNGRQMTSLITLSGGSNPAPAGDFTGSKYTYQTIAVSIAGGGGNTTMWRLDGGSNNDYMANGNLPFPFPDAVSQFSVESTALGSQNGMHTGGLVNVVTRSGTNTYHGTAFWFIRNNYINASNFFSATKDTLHQNQYGGTFGGRIIKDKLFAFAGYQRTDSKQSQASQQAFVPTAANLAGDWSGTDSPTSNPLVDPRTGAKLIGNKFPTPPTYNAQSLKLLSYFPKPDPSDPTGRVFYSIPLQTGNNQFVTRVDYTLSTRNNLYGRYFIDGYQQPAFFYPNNIFVSTQAGLSQRVQSFTLGDAFTINPRFVNTAHITLLRRRNNRGYAHNMINANTIGVDVYQGQPNGLQMTTSNKFNIGGGTNSNSNFNVNTLAFEDDVTMMLGKHQLVFGGEYARNQLNIANAYEQNGTFTFDGRYSKNGPNGGSAGGDPNLDFLMGTLGIFEQSKQQQNALRGPIPSLYIQDTYHPTNNVTIVAGLRWSPNYMPFDFFHRGVQFDYNAFLANKVSSVYPNAPAGAMYFGDPGVSDIFTKNAIWQFSPNFGFSWDPTGSGKTVIRAGAEIAYDQVNYFTAQRNQQNPPFATAIRQAQTATSGPTSFSAPWSSGTVVGSPFPQPQVPTPAIAQFFPQSQYIVLPPKYHPSSTQQWTASVQRQLGTWMLQVQYIGGHTVHAPMGTPISPAVYVPGVWGPNNTGCPGVVTTGPAGKPGIAGTPCSTVANQTQRFLLTVANPLQGNQYAGGGSSTLIGYGGMSNYHGMVTTVQHRVSTNFSLLANWTWSKCLGIVDPQGDTAGTIIQNPNNPGGDYGPCGSDYRHVENIVLITQSRFPVTGFKALLINNWVFAPLVHIQSGAPFTVTSGQDNSFTAVGNDRPNLIPGVPVYLHTPIRRASGLANRGYLNPAAFAQVTAGCPTPLSPLTCPGYGTYGNISRNSFRGPTNYQFDAQISRIFPIWERISATLRLEAFNVLNHPNFNLPTGNTTGTQGGTTGQNGALSSNTFGQITTTANQARIFQGSVKLNF